MRHFARMPRVASSREAAQSHSKRWLIDVFSFLTMVITIILLIELFIYLSFVEDLLLRTPMITSPFNATPTNPTLM